MNAGDIIGYVLLGIGILIGALLVIAMILILTTSVTIHAEYDNGIYFKVKYLFFTIAMNPESPSRIRRKKRRELKRKSKEEKLRRKNRKAEHLVVHEKKDKKKTNEKDIADEKNVAASKNDIINDKNGSGKADRDRGEQAAAPKVNSDIKSAVASEKSEQKKSKVDFQMIVNAIGAAKPHIKRLFKKIRFSGVLIDILVGGEDAAKTAVSYGIHCTAVYGFAEFLKRTVSFDSERITIKADFDLEKTDYYAKATIKLRISTALRCAVWGGLAVMKELNKAEDKGKKTSNVKKAA